MSNKYIYDTIFYGGSTMPKKNNNFFKLEMLFLKILSIRDCYGYEITHSIKELTNGKIDIKEGSMYPIQVARAAPFTPILRGTIKT